MIEGTLGQGSKEDTRQVTKVQAKAWRIEQISWQIANLRCRLRRDEAYGLDLVCVRIRQEINALMREWHKLRGEPEVASFCADLALSDDSDPAHAEAHRKELRRMFREHHGLAAYRALGEEIMEEVRHEEARMREEVEWVKGE